MSTHAISDALLDDVFSAQWDLASLAAKHHLTPATLAQWLDQPGMRQRLSLLCELADLQTQLLICRYRQAAATQLIQQATGADGQTSPEQMRKACVDLLKLNLTPGTAPAPGSTPAPAPGSAADLSDAAGVEAQIESLRRLLYTTEAHLPR